MQVGPVLSGLPVMGQATFLDVQFFDLFLVLLSMMAWCWPPRKGLGTCPPTDEHESSQRARSSLVQKTGSAFLSLGITCQSCATIFHLNARSVGIL